MYMRQGVGAKNGLSDVKRRDVYLIDNTYEEKFLLTNKIDGPKLVKPDKDSYLEQKKN